jgi:terminase small subunit / prophage DNA-packing protein
MSQPNLTMLIKQGIIDGQPRGQYDIDEVRNQYISHIRQVASGRAANGDLDLGAERARLAKEQADAKEMENAVERGELVYIERVAKEFEAQMTKVRTKLLAVPTKVAAEAHAAATVKEVQALIEIAVVEALSELVGYGRTRSGEEAA